MYDIPSRSIHELMFLFVANHSILYSQMLIIFVCIFLNIYPVKIIIIVYILKNKLNFIRYFFTSCLDTVKIFNVKIAFAHKNTHIKISLNNLQTYL